MHLKLFSTYSQCSVINTTALLYHFPSSKTEQDGKIAQGSWQGPFRTSSENTNEMKRSLFFSKPGDYYTFVSHRGQNYDYTNTMYGVYVKQYYYSQHRPK